MINERTTVRRIMRCLHVNFVVFAHDCSNTIQMKQISACAKSRVNFAGFFIASNSQDTH